MEHIHAMQDQAAGKGMLQINVTSAADSRPVQGALVSISARVDQMDSSVEELLEGLQQVDGVLSIDSISDK